MATATVGNKNLISNEEEKWVDLLRERNLKMVNEKKAEVHPADNLYVRYIKRGLDLLVGVPAFVILLPLNVILGICSFVYVGPPIFYKQTRVGKNGKTFIMVKFRNMNNNKDDNGRLLPASQRVTKFGKFMRKFSLDELLNFWSVVKGDMSIIGPRPLPEFFIDRMSERHKMRNAVRPGLECPYTMPEGSEISAYHWKFENDIWYIENVSFKTDVIMLVKLIKLTFNFKDRGSHAGGLSYQRTLGELFFFLMDEMADITFSHSLCILMEAMMASLQEILKLSNEQILSFTVDFEKRLPKYLQKVLHSTAESA